MKPKVVITGASGFLGSALAGRLHREHYNALGLSRASIAASFPIEQVSSLNDIQLPARIFDDCAVVVHCAARTHVMNESIADPLSEFRKVNVEATKNLARKAAEQGVRRFIFISSIKVNGEQTTRGSFFKADDPAAPQDAYGLSKWEAEQALHAIAVETGMDVVIIRPPLIYGMGVKGNFASMIKLVAKGYPLPLGSVQNKRSLVSLDNVIDLIVTCIESPAAANQVFLAGDGEDLSTSDLLRRVAAAMHKPSRLLPIPPVLLETGAALLGKRPVAQRLLGSLQVDISKAQQLLGWTPPLSVDEGLERCFYLDQE